MKTRTLFAFALLAATASCKENTPTATTLTTTPTASHESKDVGVPKKYAIARPAFNDTAAASISRY